MTPRGIRNNNPGNIRHGTHTYWVGESKDQPDPAFVSFSKPEYGVRALMKILQTYYNKYALITIKMLINRYAPPTENDTASYINAVSKLSGTVSDAVIDDIDVLLIPLAKSITLHENGPAPEGLPPYWYPDSVYEAAKKMANS